MNIRDATFEIRTPVGRQIGVFYGGDSDVQIRKEDSARLARQIGRSEERDETIELITVTFAVARPR